MQFDIYEEIKVIFSSEKKKIWLVRDQITGVFYVKKIIHDIQNEELYKRLKEIHHPNIVSVRDYTMLGNDCIVIEEFLNGVTLAYQMSITPLTYQQINLYMTQLMEALTCLHQQGNPLIHRDIKPENIYVVNDVVKLMDFEISRTYKEHQERDTCLMGSVGFASPEHYGFRQCDERSDIYSLGVVLKSMVQEDIQAACVPSPYEPIIQRCMQLDPMNRYQNVKEMKDAFTTIILKQELPSSQATAKKQWYVPGFAKETIGKRLLIYVYYVFSFCIAWPMEIDKGTTLQNGTVKIVTLLACFVTIWIALGDNVYHKTMPLLRSTNYILRSIGFFLLWLVVLLIAITITSIFILPLEGLF